MKLLAGPEPGLVPTRPAGTRPTAKWPLLAAVAVAVSACSDPADPNQVGPFLIQLFGFITLCFIVSIGGGLLLMKKLTGGLLGSLSSASPGAGGLQGDAVIESIGDTGITVTMPSVGPNAPEYKLGLQVTAPGGAPYHVDIKALIPRIYAPMILPGAQVGVQIDPNDPQKVSLDFSRIGGAAARPVGRPAGGEVDSLVGAVRSGTVPTIEGSADRLLATGTHGTAVITTAQPLGTRVRDVMPTADPSRLDDPIWVFSVQVSVAGENPFPAVFGHRVPIAKVIFVAPGVKLAVAVNLNDRMNEVAIDWEKSPLAG